MIALRRVWPTSTYPGQILADNPVAYWPCQERAGSVLTDLTGHGYDLQCYGGTTLGQAGPYGWSSVAFDGSTGYAQALRTPQPAWVAGSTRRGMTLEVWGQITNNLPHYGFLAGIRDGGSGEFYILQLQNTNTFETRYTNSAGDHQDFDGQSDVPTWTPEAWHHGALVYDAVAQSLTFYTDGQPVAQRTATGTITVTPMTFWLGAQGSNGGNFFQGRLAHGALYAYPLSDTQIQRHVNTARLRLDV